MEEENITHRSIKGEVEEEEKEKERKREHHHKKDKKEKKEKKKDKKDSKKHSHKKPSRHPHQPHHHHDNNTSKHRDSTGMEYSSSESETEKNDMMKYVESRKGQEKVTSSTIANSASIPIKRDDWMMAPPRETSSEKQNGQANEEKKETIQLAQKETNNDPDVFKPSSREINPYFANGGHGLPEKEESSQIRRNEDEKLPSSSSSSSLSTSSTTGPRKFKFGDAGSSWRMIKLKRVYEAAEEEGRNVEEIALERYGSPAAFQEALDEKDYLDERRSRTPKFDNRETGITKEKSSNAYRSTVRGGSSASFKRPNEDNHHHAHGRHHNHHNHQDQTTNFFESHKKPRIQDIQDIESSKEQNTYSVPYQVLPDTNKLSVPSSIPPARTEPSTPALSKSDLNRLKIQLMKAEMSKSLDVEELKRKYEAEVKRTEMVKSNQTIILPTVDAYGKLVDVGSSDIKDDGMDVGKSRRKKPEKVQTHNEKGERIRYENDDNVTLEDLVRQEKMGTRDNFDMEYASRITSDTKFEDDFDYMDDHAEEMAKSKKRNESQKKNIAISDYLKSKRAQETCLYCYQDSNPPQVPVISLGTKTLLCLPLKQEMIPGHCFIVPIQHVLSTLECDDDVWTEIRNFMKTLTLMFAKEKKGVIFMEMVINRKWQKHAVIECIPVPFGLVDDAPAFFKDAILNADSEWSQHKPLIDTLKTPFRRAMVPNLPYFHVWFNPNGGLGHVIEEPENWKEWFGREVLGGMMDISSDKWRKIDKKNKSTKSGSEVVPKNLRIQNFVKKWRDYDWTVALEGGDYQTPT